VFCYTERNDPAVGSIVPAFTEIVFQWGRCTSVYQAGDDVYLTSYDGYLYKLDELLSTDEVTQGVTESYVASVRGKMFTFGGDGILRKLQYYITPKSVGTAIMSILTDASTSITVKTITLAADGQYLYDATGYLYDATQFLYDLGSSPVIETTRNRVRSDEMAFQLEVTTGRCGIEWCKAEIAFVEGGN
jgi:hypothetical protein